jgi:hypothetical protein
MDSSKSKQKEASIIPINESMNFNQDQEDMFNSSLPFSSSQKLKNTKSKEEIDSINDKEDDPNFADSKLKKEEEERRRKAVEEFEKRKMKKNKNIIDYDEISDNKNKTKKNKDDTQVEDEGIIIENFNYISKPKINNINYKNSLGKKKEIEDLESKTSQIKQITSYSKDDLNININSSPDKNKKDNNKFKFNNNIINKNMNSIKESDINSNSNFDNNESNYDMNFYDTLRKSKIEDSKNQIGVFESLLPNKSFKKFLKDKIKYYMDEKDIPTSFIKNLYDESIVGNIPNSEKINNLEANYGSINNEKLNINIYQNEIQYNNNTHKPQNKNKNKMNNIKRNKSLDLFYPNKKLTNKNNYTNILLENDINKKQLEEMQKELTVQKNEMNEKNQKINLLQNMNNNLKQEMNKLQENFENERIDNTQNRKNYAMIKTCYNDIKNQYDLLNMKYMTLNDENFNFRRNKELYERQLALKNEMIENLIENKTNLQKQKVKNQLNKINFSTKNSHKIITTFLQNNNKEDKKLEEKNNDIKNIKEKNNSINNIDYNKYNKLSFPELQCKRDELTKERKDINNIYSKIPLKTYNKEINNKRNNLEKRLQEINCELMLVKLSIKNFKNHK